MCQLSDLGIFDLDSPISHDQFNRIIDYQLDSSPTPTEGFGVAGPSHTHESDVQPTAHGDGPPSGQDVPTDPANCPIIFLTSVDDPT